MVDFVAGIPATLYRDIGVSLQSSDDRSSSVPAGGWPTVRLPAEPGDETA